MRLFVSITFAALIVWMTAPSNVFAEDCGYKADGKYHCGIDCGYKADGKYHCGTGCGYKADGNFHCSGDD